MPEDRNMRISIAIAELANSRSVFTKSYFHINVHRAFHGLRFYATHLERSARQSDPFKISLLPRFQARP